MMVSANCTRERRTGSSARRTDMDIPWPGFNAAGYANSMNPAGLGQCGVLSHDRSGAQPITKGAVCHMRRVVRRHSPAEFVHPMLGLPAVDQMDQCDGMVTKLTCSYGVLQSEAHQKHCF